MNPSWLILLFKLDMSLQRLLEVIILQKLDTNKSIR